ncbi:inositol monophosphatase family protein [Kitasatospora sp. NPDC050543]|uniref:inositol monophosphatase family protein n=1 Tax=Kitasatospora sp. NPDC050543 TaxID=3364054 RepID=UPI003788DFC6
MRGLVQELSRRIRAAVRTGLHDVGSRYVKGTAKGGDAEFPVDVLAERAAWDFLREQSEPVAVYTESEGLRTLGRNPAYVLIIDPIDGTRGAAADLEMACVSIAAAPFGEAPVIGDIRYAMLQEIKSGNWLYADTRGAGIESGGFPAPVPRLSPVADLDRMFWSLEFNGHPAELMTGAYGHLIDASANTGGVYVFNSASFSISRIITGQMDAYVDIGNRLLRDRPATEADFRRVGHGSILHLFPYDIAASVFLAERAGVTITDAYGKPLHDTLLLDISPLNQRSCIAACTPQLHAALIDSIRW